MLNDNRHIDFFKEIASNQYSLMIIEEYGIESQDYLITLTDGIGQIYRHLAYNTFDQVVILVSIDGNTDLKKTFNQEPTVITSYENLASISGSTVVIEIRQDGNLKLLVDIPIDLSHLRNNNIVYRYSRAELSEVFYGKSKEQKLRSIPDADTYFSIQSYKDLDLALEDYGSKIARLSSCPYLENIWFDENHLFFKAKPEHVLRDSLTHFLKIRLRNTEVRPEQIVDKSHPVDIKVTWTLTNHMALIEIKWMGKSLKSRNKSFSQVYTRVRALSGAEQLSSYLDANMIQSPNKSTRGYLVTYDARRWGLNPKSQTVNGNDGFKYRNEVIRFDPEYHHLRNDFAPPVRFFMEPKITASV